MQNNNNSKVNNEKLNKSAIVESKLGISLIGNETVDTQWNPLFNKEEKILDQVIEKIDYDGSVYFSIFLVFLLLCLEGLNMTLFSTLIITLKKLFLVNDHYLEALSATLFFGVGLGSAISGILTEKYGRINVIHTFTFFMFLSNFCLAFTNNFFFFGCLRFLIGFCIGVVIPSGINLLAEKLPSHFRSFWLNIVWLGFNTGNLYLLFNTLLIMPNFEVDGIKKLLFICSLLPFIVLLLNLFFLEDSYRNMILKGNENVAFNQIEQKLNITLTFRDKRRIFHENTTGVNKDDGKSAYSKLFSGKYLLLTILLLMIWFINSVIYFGPMTIMALTLKDLGLNKSTGENSADKNVLLNLIQFGLINSPGYLVGGLISEVPFLGRKKSSLAVLFLGILFLFLSITFPSKFIIFFNLSQMNIAVLFNITTAYTSEVYPTKLRDHVVGMLFAFTRMGGFLSQFLFIDLYEFGLFAPYIIALIFMVINFISVWLLPYETYGKPLDEEY